MSEQSEQAERFSANRAHWDERVPIHLGSAMYDVDSFLAGDGSLPAFELEDLPDVGGRSLLHLQCHIGLDTLLWARRGARVTGLDFSAPAVAAARDLAARAGLAAEFVEASVYDAVAVLEGRRFDVVHTGIGALNWLDDLRRWAATVAALVAPGGTFYLAEFHPFSWVLDDDRRAVEPYFHDEPFAVDDPGSYAARDASTVHNRTYEWNHGIGAVVSALIDAGLRIELLREHDYTLFPQWPSLVRTERGYEPPDGAPSLPLMYSLRAVAPA